MHPDAVEQLKEWKDQFIYEPEDLGATWEEARGKILNDDVSCIVLAAAHNEFRSTYVDIFSAEDRPAIADLCNAITPWLRDEVEKNTADPGAAGRYRRATERDYALLGLSQQTKLAQKEARPADVILS